MHGVIILELLGGCVPTALIVDDSATIRLCLRVYLENLGFQVVAEAENGVQAIEAHKRHRPDLITLDLVMPHLSGMEALREIRRRDPLVSVLIVTSGFTLKIKQEAEELGVQTLLLKPVSQDKLQQGLEALALFRKERKYG
ncbi:response regulator [bacterium]|nr:response regulator [bacterium]